jgi:hypothetical protein
VQHARQLPALRLLVLKSRQRQAPEALLGIGVRLRPKPAFFYAGFFHATIEIRDNSRKFQWISLFSKLIIS